MSRLYSGNLNDNIAARKRLTRMDCEVESRGEHDEARMQHYMTLTVSLLPGGDLVGHQDFAHRDIDVLYNTATAWLNGLADALAEWRPINPH